MSRWMEDQRLKRWLGRSLLGVLGAIALVVSAHLPLWSQSSSLVASSRSPGAVVLPSAEGQGGAVASVDHRATQIGIDVLRAGGNAIDAAIATAAALGVTDPFSCGIGGGDFMVIYLNDGSRDGDRVMTLDGREQAPAAITADLFRDPTSPTGEPLPFIPQRITSGLAVGVPGTPATWSTALRRYGTRSLAEILEPAIQLAESGFDVDDTFAQQVQLNQPRFAMFPASRDLFLPGGSVPAVGDRFRNPDLANTYRLLATAGVEPFYRGEVAEAIVQTVQQPPTIEDPPFPVYPGQMTLADLDAYHLRVRPAVHTDYRGYQVYGMGLPSSGGITSLEVLNILKDFDSDNSSSPDLTPDSPPTALIWHRLIEAERLAFADRNAYLGDPEYVDAPVAGLISPNYGALRQDRIGDRAASSAASPGNPFLFQTDPSPSGFAGDTPIAIAPGDSHEGNSTTHLVVSDRQGNVVSYTLTIETTGGTGMVVPGYGFLLNNELTDFDTVMPHPNSPEPGKRPRSSMAPTVAIAPDGSILAWGSPGGSTIITTVLGIGVNLMDFQRTMAEAITFPRISQRNGDTTSVDSGLDQQSLGNALRQWGHTLNAVGEIGAATGLVVFPDGTIEAAAEPSRRGGGAAMTVE